MTDPVPASTRAALASVGPDGSLALLLRHAARAPHPEDLPPEDAPLLPEGLLASRALGARIGARLVGLYTSPVRRCVETATAVRAGAGLSLALVEDRRLGAPGAFVRDAALAGRTWRSLGHGAVMDALARGERLQGFEDPRVASASLLAWMEELARASPGITLLISHDAVVWPVAVFHHGWSADRRRWPSWLEGVAWS